MPNRACLFPRRQRVTKTPASEPRFANRRIELEFPCGSRRNVVPRNTQAIGEYAMIATIIRYGIVGLAAALAALSSREAAGGIWPFGHHDRCRTCPSDCRDAGDCGCGSHGGLFSWLFHGICRDHRCRRVCVDSCGTAYTAGCECGATATVQRFPPSFRRIPVAHSPAAMVRRPRRPVTPPPVPPPGTLGRTYRQLSTPIPADEHPRTGMLQICNVPPGVVVTVNGMEGYRRTNGVWHFRTKRPLIPTVPFIKTVRIHGPNFHPHAAGTYRVVRLIPDRTVYLKW